MAQRISVERGRQNIDKYTVNIVDIDMNVVLPFFIDPHTAVWNATLAFGFIGDNNSQAYKAQCSIVTCHIKVQFYDGYFELDVIYRFCIFPRNFKYMLQGRTL